MTSHYSVLGISPSASKEEIKAAYRRAAMATHPDRGGSATDFRRVNDAYKVLSDDEAKCVYDSTLKQRPTKHFSDVYDRQITVSVDRPTAIYGGVVEFQVGNKTIKLMVTPGTIDHQMYTLRGIARDIFGEEYRDLLVIIKIKEPAEKPPHKVEVTISMLTMVFGGEVVVELTNGKSLLITIPKMTPPGKVLRVLDEITECGDVLLTVTPVLPQEDDENYRIISELLKR